MHTQLHAQMHINIHIYTTLHPYTYYMQSLNLLPYKEHNELIYAKLIIMMYTLINALEEICS